MKKGNKNSKIKNNKNLKHKTSNLNTRSNSIENNILSKGSSDNYLIKERLLLKNKRRNSLNLKLNLKPLLRLNLNLNRILILVSLISLVILFILNYNFVGSNLTLSNIKDYELFNIYTLFLIILLLLNLSVLFINTYTTPKKDFELDSVFYNLIKGLLIDLGLINLNFILLSIVKLNTFSIGFFNDVTSVSIYIVEALLLFILLFRFISKFLKENKENLEISLINLNTFKYLTLSLIFFVSLVTLLFSNLYTFLILIISGILSLGYIYLTK